MSRLLIGPMLRYVGAEGATIWMELDRPGAVTVLGRTARTFSVAGHHYALAVLRELGPDPVAYTVEIDGEQVWPAEAGWPPSVIPPAAPPALRIAFGSCRVAGSLEDPERGVDALHALAARMRMQPVAQWPHLLALVGDQVYADDNISAGTAAFIAQRRDVTDPDGPGPEVADYEEYSFLYRESWTPWPIRWLLSTLPTCMIFDDHDIRDDWNTSEPWRRMISAKPWWPERITAGLASYWVHQHLGNLSPSEIDADGTLDALCAAEDGARILRSLAERADAAADGAVGVHWSYRRDYGAYRLVVLDSRCNRVVHGDRRLMVGDAEWAWFDAQLTGDVDHLVIVTSVPLLLPPGVHALEAFDEALAQGRWGAPGRRLGERMRQAADLEHWPAFGRSFQRMSDLLAEVGSGRRGRAPSTITLLSGDVHFAYVAEAAYTHRPDVTSRIIQAVCSPLRNPLPTAARIGERVASTGAGRAIGRLLTGVVRARTPDLSWHVDRGPAFGNEIATVVADGERLCVTVEAARPGPRLEHAFSFQVSGAFGQGR